MLGNLDHRFALSLLLVVKPDKNGDRHNKASEHAKHGDGFANHGVFPVSAKCNAKVTSLKREVKVTFRALAQQ